VRWPIGYLQEDPQLFWDIFSIMISMKPKKFSGKEQSNESSSARHTNSATLENDLGAAMTHD
jgi:hypothetical protein